MTTIEIYSNIDALSDKIYELRADGVKDKNMIVVAKKRLDATFLRYTSVPFRKSNGTMWDRIAAKFLNEDSGARVVQRLKLTGEDHAPYREAIDNGSIILLVRSGEDEVEAIEDEQGELKTQDQALKAYGLQSEKTLQHEMPKKKHDAGSEKTEIIHEEGNKRIVSDGDNAFTIVNMKHELTEKDK